MGFTKRFAVVLFMGFFLCGGLFAQSGGSIIDTNLDGNALNSLILDYIGNIARLIPDSTTTQNIWSYAPRSDKGLFSVGMSGSFVMSERSMLGPLIEAQGAGSGFGGKNEDIMNIPVSIPYLPVASFDLRFGGRRGNSDFGIAGMWASADIIPELAHIVGESSDYTHRTIGFDYRYALTTDGINKIFGLDLNFIPAKSMPALTLQVGYYFTWMSFGFASGTEEVSIDFRNDSYFFAFQVSKESRMFKPYIGIKYIASRTDSEFEWESYRPVQLNGKYYPLGVRYESGTNIRDSANYLHLYGGLGLRLIFDHVVTLGVSYSIFTEHFGINAAVRLLFK